jgi:hypothetical protein
MALCTERSRGRAGEGSEVEVGRLGGPVGRGTLLHRGVEPLLVT